MSQFQGKRKKEFRYRKLTEIWKIQFTFLIWVLSSNGLLRTALFILYIHKHVFSFSHVVIQQSWSKCDIPPKHCWETALLTEVSAQLCLCLTHSNNRSNWRPSLCQNSSASELFRFTSSEKACLICLTVVVLELFEFSLPAMCSFPEIAQLLLVVSDGRGLFLEGKDRVLAAVQAARNANIFVIFVVLDNPSSRVSDY